MYTVLVVDDVRGMAEQLADLIKMQTGLDALACHTPEAALQAVQENPIRVALLDQRMPSKAGTELYEEICELNPSIKAIMITGEASASEVGQAMSLGFSQYLEKGEVAKVPEVVLKWYFQYQVEQAAELRVTRPELLHSGRRRFLLFGDRVQYRLMALQVIDESYVVPDSWSTIQQINAGQEKKFTYTLSVKDTFLVESSRQYAAKGGISRAAVKGSRLNANIESTVTKALKKSRTSETASSATTEVTYRLPEDSSNPSENYVKSRHIQSAPLYKRVRLSVVKYCTCCREESFTPLIAIAFDGAYATRQIDYYRDGSSATIDTGVIRLADSVSQGG